MAHGGTLRAGAYGDVHLYAAYARNIAHGRWPYRDFFDEYPPLAQPLFYVVHVLPGSYAHAFRWTMAICGAGAVALLVATLASIAEPRARIVLAATAAAAAPIVAGPYFLNAYDLFPALLVSAALLAFIRRHERLAYVLLALAVAAKVYPVVLLPLAVVETWNRGGRDATRRSLAWFAGALVVVHLPFLVAGPGGLRYSYWVQVKRGLEVHSLGGSVLHAAHYGTLRVQAPGSTNVVGSLASATATLTSIVAMSAVLYVAWEYFRRRSSLVGAAAAAVTGFLAFGKVFSAQYVDWLVPLVPAAGTVASALMLVVLGLTRVVFGTEGGKVGWLLARNLLVVVLYVWLVVRLRRSPAARTT